MMSCDCINPFIFCIFIKQTSKYRAYDAEENGCYIDEFMMTYHSVRSNGILKRRLLLFSVTNMLFEETKKESSVLFLSVMKNNYCSI